MYISKGLIWHQIATRTWADRYLLEFLIVKELISPKRILSFGCSTGEECQTLKGHFPDAEVIGCDINPDVLRTAKMRFPAFKFLFSDIQSLKNQQFDAIFAMNVFHRNTVESQTLPEYERCYFDEQIAQLRQVLVKKGALVLYASQFKDPEGFKLLGTYGKLDIYTI